MLSFGSTPQSKQLVREMALAYAELTVRGARAELSQDEATAAAYVTNWLKTFNEGLKTLAYITGRAYEMAARNVTASRVLTLGSLATTESIQLRHLLEVLEPLGRAFDREGDEDFIEEMVLLTAAFNPEPSPKG